MSHLGIRSGGYDTSGYYGLPDPSPEPTDPHLGLTAADVVAWIMQQRETAGTPIELPSPERFAAAETYVEMALVTLRATPASEQP